MVAIEDIEDRDSLEAWLEARPGETRERESAVIVHRMAMRDLPDFLSWMHSRSHDDALTELWMLRPLLISGVVANKPTPEAGVAAETAFSSVKHTLAFRRESDAERFATARVVALAVLRTAASDVGRAAAFTSASDPEKFWAAIRTDCAAIEAGDDPLSRPLWHDAPNPLAEDWARARARWQEDDKADWSFWIRWYESFLDPARSRPLPLKLLEQIALQPDEWWDRPPAQVNADINAMWERFELAREARELAANWPKPPDSAATVAHRSHNMPPELVDDIRVVEKGITIIWASLEEAAEELEKPEPDKGRLEKIARALLAATKAVALYCASKADVALTKAAEEVGSSGTKWAIRIGVAAYASQTPQVQDFATRLLELVTRALN